MLRVNEGETLSSILVSHSWLVATAKRILICFKTAPLLRTARKPVARQETSFKTNKIHFCLQYRSEESFKGYLLPFENGRMPLYRFSL